MAGSNEGAATSRIQSWNILVRALVPNVVADIVVAAVSDVHALNMLPHPVLPIVEADITEGGVTSDEHRQNILEHPLVSIDEKCNSVAAVNEVQALNIFSHPLLPTVVAAICGVFCSDEHPLNMFL